MSISPDLQPSGLFVGYARMPDGTRLAKPALEWLGAEAVATATALKAAQEQRWQEHANWRGERMREIEAMPIGSARRVWGRAHMALVSMRHEFNERGANHPATAIEQRRMDRLSIQNALLEPYLTTSVAGRGVVMVDMHAGDVAVDIQSGSYVTHWEEVLASQGPEALVSLHMVSDDLYPVATVLDATRSLCDSLNQEATNL